MSKTAKLVAVCLVWVGIAAVAAGVWRWVVAPERQEAAVEQARQRDEEVLARTSGESRYRQSVRLALDSFSGYCVLRSPAFREELARRRVRLELVDDGADYPARLAALADGSVPVAAFTIDALIKTSAEAGSLPATIVAILDESRGADAVVAYENAVPSLDALDAADARFVVTADSPSETLARVAVARFDLTNLPPDPFVRLPDAAAVFDRYRTAGPDEPVAYVLWEPYVSRVLENPETHVLFDSSVRGYIVDVLAVSRDYLVKNPDLVRDLLESYFRANYRHRDDRVGLVLADAEALGEPLTAAQAGKLADGIWWKNTVENYAHFEPAAATGAAGDLQYVEDMVGRITDVLASTGGIDADPTGGRPNRLFFPGVLDRLESDGFHPGVEPEAVRDDVALPALSDAEWDRLRPVGTLEVPDLVFPAGRSALGTRSRRILDELTDRLAEFPTGYVLVRGNAARRGDPAANRRLAAARAEAACDYLVERGVAPTRLRAAGGDPSGSRSVSFVIGRPPF